MGDPKTPIFLRLTMPNISRHLRVCPQEPWRKLQSLALVALMQWPFFTFFTSACIYGHSSQIAGAARARSMPIKVIIQKSRGEVPPVEQETFDYVSSMTKHFLEVDFESLLQKCQFEFIIYNTKSYSQHTSWIGFQTAKKLATSNLVFQAFERFIGT